MSTKIYDGFVFVPKDIETINKKIQEFRHKIDEYISREYKRHVAGISSYFFDKVCCGLEKDKKNDGPFLYAINFMHEETRLIKKSMERNMFDLGCSTTIHLYKKRFYGILYSNDNNIKHMWFSQPWVKEYSYWDNTDALEGISDKEWQQRGRDWDKILKDFYYIPSMNGLVAEFTKDMFYYIPHSGVEGILPFISDYTKRLHKIAYNYLFEDFCKMKKSGKIAQDFFAFNKWIKNGNPGFKKLIEVKNGFTKKMKKEITKEMLLGK